MNKFLTQTMNSFSKKLDRFQEENSKQHGKLFDDVKRLMVKDAGQKGDFLEVGDNRYTSKLETKSLEKSISLEIKNIKDSIKGLNQLANKFMVGLIVFLLGFTGYGLKLFVGYLIASVKAFF